MINSFTQCDYAIDEAEDSIKSKLDMLNKYTLKFKHQTYFQNAKLLKKKKSMTTFQYHQDLLNDSFRSDEESSEINMSDSDISQENKFSDILCQYKDSFFNEKIKLFNENKTKKSFYSNIISPRNSFSEIDSEAVRQQNEFQKEKQLTNNSIKIIPNSPGTEYKYRHQLSRFNSNQSRMSINPNINCSISQYQHQDQSSYTIDVPINESLTLNSSKQLIKYSDQEIQNMLIESIFRQNYTQFKKLLIQMSKEYRTEILNQRDNNGNTLLMLVIKLSYRSPQHENIRLLLANGADPSIKDKLGWAPIEETVAQMDILNTSLLFDYLVQKKLLEIQQERYRIDQELNQMDDFYIEMKWEFHSSIIPFLSKFAPNDVFKIYKRGSSIRLDSTFAGQKNLKSKRRPISVIYNPLDGKKQRRENQANCQFLVMINKQKGVYYYPLEEIDPEEKKQILMDLINSETVSGQIKVIGCQLNKSRSFFGGDIITKIGEWDCNKYEFKVNYEQSFNKQNRRHLYMNYDQYSSAQFDNLNSARQGQDIDYLRQDSQFDKLNIKQLNKSCSMHITDKFPIKFSQLLTIIKMLGKGNEFIYSLDVILNDEKVRNLLKGQGFPVKIEIPISFTIDAIVTFQSYKKIDYENQQSVDYFQIPQNYQLMSRKEAQKTMHRGKKRLLLANFFL